VIEIKGGNRVEFDVLVTRHGPVISSLIPGETRQLALRWTAYEPGALQVPFFDVNTAQNWEEFRHAFSRLGAPGQNVVYADVDGHIGYQATGRYPIRPAATPPDANAQEPAPPPVPTGYGDGSLPVPGNDNAHEWTGFIPYAQLPSVFDPPNGVLATANGRITPDGYPYPISTHWGPPYRTERIYRVLQNGKKLTHTDMLPLQTDVYSEFDRFCAQRLVYAVDHTPGASSRAKDAAELMRGWDGKITTESAAATLVAYSRRNLVALLLGPKAGSGRENWSITAVALESILQRRPKRWLPEKYGSYEELLAAAVEAAVTHKDAPANLKEWTWGKNSVIEVQHPIFGSVPVLRRWSGTGVWPQSGSGYTVKQVGRTFGPSERLTVDLSDLDRSTVNIVNGQSGNLFSPLYNDQWSAWYEGRSFELPFSEAAVQKAAVHRLVLRP
jgi:penicillin amidase